MSLPDRSATAPLSDLIEQLGRGVGPFDEGFARALAQALHARAAHVRIPAVDRLGLEDVVATFYMDRRMRLVVTGHLPDVRGAVSVSWDEGDFPALPVTLYRDEVDAPYTFATLDFSVRGREGVLLAPAPPLPEGQTVRVRALATIGGREEYRVAALGLERSVPPERLALS